LGRDIEYSPRERFWLWTLAVFGIALVNGAFVHGLLFQPGTLADAMTNPIAAAFMVEALVLVGVFAYLLSKWKVNRLAWGWLVLLSLPGEYGVRAAYRPALASRQARINRVTAWGGHRAARSSTPPARLNSDAL
jgi:hypothetical protein